MSESPNLSTPDGDIVAARPVAYAPAAPRSAPFDLTSIARRVAALDLALVVLVALLVPVGVELSVGLFVTEIPALSFNWVIVVHKWFDALLVVGLAAYLVYRHRLPVAAFGMQADGLARQALWTLPTLCGVYAVFMGMFLIVAGVTLLDPQVEQDLLRRTEFLELLPLNNLTATMFLLIPVALHEELLFRGLLIPYLHRVGCGWTGAILLSSAVFAVLHVAQGWLGVIQIFGVGIVLGLFFLVSRSLLAVILAHLIFNLMQFQMARYLLPWVEKFTGPG